MKIEVLEDKSILIICACGQTHRLKFSFKDGEGNEVEKIFNDIILGETKMESYGTSQ